MAAVSAGPPGGTMAAALGAGACSCRGARFRRYRRELGQLTEGPDSKLALVRRRCPDMSWSELPINNTVDSPLRCAAGRVAALVLCSQARLLRHDLVGMLQYLARANGLMPFAAPCLNRDAWPISAAEIYDNYSNALRVLGPHLAPDDEEKQGFFKKALSQKDFAERVGEKASELFEDLQWRSQADKESGVRKVLRHPRYSSAAPADLPLGASNSDIPCGLGEMADPVSKMGPVASTSSESTARALSSSGCVWLLENACIEERHIVLFAKSAKEHKLPDALMGCGEFGNYDFNAVEVRHPRSRLQLLSNRSQVHHTLLVVPGLLSGVSLHNPFHLLHAAVPVTWQLHHPSYGLCIPRGSLDMRFAFMNAFHAKRSAHFWRIFTNPRRPPISGESLEQRFAIASTWRFWWGPLSVNPPMPLGADSSPRCYRRVIFGRELFRTGIGGFGSPRVLAFYRRYLEDVLRSARAGSGPEYHKPEESPTDDAEWSIFEHMRSGAPRRDVLAIWEWTRKYGGSFFTAEGAARLALPPLRLWKAEGSLATADDGGPMPVLSPEDRVPTRVIHSAAASGVGPARWLHTLLVQRPKGAGRQIANIDDVISWAEKWQHPQARLALLISDLGEFHPVTQWQLARQSHVLIAVTGAALGWLAFLPLGSVVLDVFPPGSNFCRDGWGSNPVSHYGGLARLSGVQHACMVHPAALQGPVRSGVDPEHQARQEVREKLGGFWHGQNVHLDMSKFQLFFEEAAKRALAQDTR